MEMAPCADLDLKTTSPAAFLELLPAPAGTRFVPADLSSPNGRSRFPKIIRRTRELLEQQPCPFKGDLRRLLHGVVVQFDLMGMSDCVVLHADLPQDICGLIDPALLLAQI
jgi:hypothetical protein